VYFAASVAGHALSAVVLKCDASSDAERREREDAADDETARVIMKSLGGIGNAWAWKALSAQREARATRAVAAEALGNAFFRFGGDVREQAAKALLVVGDASTPSVIAIARKNASAELAADLELLDRRSATKPTR